MLPLYSGDHRKSTGSSASGTFDQLIELDIPNFENIVNNEFANIDSSYEAFNKQGTINAYTKNEIMNMDTKVLQEFNRKTTI